MTNTPIRKIVYVACEPIEDELTLRNLVEWSKRVTDAVGDLDPSPQELAYIQQAWADMVDQKAAAEGIGGGYLSYMLQELQVSEERILQQAMEDVGSI